MNASVRRPSSLAEAQHLVLFLSSGLALLESASLVPEDQRDEVYRNVLLVACSLIGQLTAARDAERKIAGAA